MDLPSASRPHLTPGHHLLDIWTPITPVGNDIFDSFDSRSPYTSEQDDLDFFSDSATSPPELNQRVQCRLSSRRHVDRGENPPCYW
jgi:hypothetical protein